MVPEFCFGGKKKRKKKKFLHNDVIELLQPGGTQMDFYDLILVAKIIIKTTLSSVLMMYSWLLGSQKSNKRRVKKSIKKYTHWEESSFLGNLQVYVKAKYFNHIHIPQRFFKNHIFLFFLFLKSTYFDVSKLREVKEPKISIKWVY